MKVEEFLDDWTKISKHSQNLGLDYQMDILRQWVSLKQKTVTVDYIKDVLLGGFKGISDTILSEVNKVGVADEQVKELKSVLEFLQQAIAAAESKKTSTL